MPGSGHNAFQRSAFQRSAFQIVYTFVPTVTGGVIVGGDVTTRFRKSFNPVVTGGIIVGGEVTTRFSTSGAHRPIVTGGIIIGGDVRTRFTPGVIPPPPVRKIGTGGRVWNNILRRKRHYKILVTGGVVVGGSVTAAFYSQRTELILEVESMVAYLSLSSGGVFIGGQVETIFTSVPPPPITPPAIEVIVPEGKSFELVSSGAKISLGGGVQTRFVSNPPPPEAKKSARISWLEEQRRVEEELLLLDLI